METILDANEPYFRVDLGIHLPMPIYFAFIGAHMIAHYKLLTTRQLSQSMVQWLSGAIVTSMILLPLWRGVNPEHPLVDMGLSFGCVFSAIRIALLTATVTKQKQMITAAATHKKFDDVNIANDNTDTDSNTASTVQYNSNDLQLASLGDYIRHMYLEESTPTRHLSVEEIEKSNGRSVASAVDSIQAQLIQLTIVTTTGLNRSDGTRYPSGYDTR
ncbi:hypothetical protein BDF22DRAFT_779331 [Syncephalis plumigaleata]|nr:hypothetical protein BDF22DRAFT_779331 [Syncephalis plumigaleata]